MSSNLETGIFYSLGETTMKKMHRMNLGTTLYDANFEEMYDTSILRGIFEAMDGLELSQDQFIILGQVAQGKTLDQAILKL